MRQVSTRVGSKALHVAPEFARLGLAGELLWAAPMSHSASAPKRSLSSLLSRRVGRLPMDVAAQLAHGVLAALTDDAAPAASGQPLDAGAFLVGVDGRVTLGRGASGEVASDARAVGGVLYWLFTGVAPKAGASGAVPPASQLNPALDDELDALVSSLLSAGPATGAGCLDAARATVLCAMDDLDLAVDVGQVARCLAVELRAPEAEKAAPAPRPGAVKVAAAPRPTRRPPPVWERDDDDDDEADDVEAPVAWTPALRVDGWALAAAGFAVVALVFGVAL